MGLAVSLVSLALANYYLGAISDDTGKATIAAATITVFGVIFSAVYKEISDYYQERAKNTGKKWELIFPFIKNHYIPWINSAKSFQASLSGLIKYGKNDEVVNRILFLTMIFYGIRLRFITKDGGLILLSTNKEELEVEKAYRAIESSYQWADSETPRRVSYLQHLFLTKNKENAPYILASFTNDLAVDRNMQDSKLKLDSWLSKDENIKGLDKSLEEFIQKFKSGIDGLYTAWGD